MLPTTPPALYADDLTILCPLSREHSALRDQQLQSAQQTLNNVTAWGSKWRLFFHKTQLLVFSPHGANSINTQPGIIRLKLHNTTVTPTQSEPIRLLGVWLDSHLSMKAHIDYIVARVNPRLNLLKSVSSKTWGADRNTLLLLYKLWIRPVIEYSSTSYASASPKTLKRLDSLQTQAARIIVGASKTASTIALHSILKLQTLGIRRLRTAATLYAKYQRGDTRDSCINHWTQWLASSTNTPQQSDIEPNATHQIPRKLIPEQLYYPSRLHSRHTST